MLADLLLNAGLLQFGRFANDRGWKPYQLNLDMLPSYPDILKHMVDIGAPLVGSVDHLVCPLDGLPFGVALSQQTGVPLAYNRGDNLVGAYDIGHPALLVANDISEKAELERLITRARRVGLEIDRALIIVTEGRSGLGGVKVETLLDLSNSVQSLIQTDRLPLGQGRAVMDWISLHHPD